MQAHEVRMVQEWKDLKEKTEKLRNVLIKYNAGTLDFQPACPGELLSRQLEVMEQYLFILEVRAEIEKIDLKGAAI